MARYIVGIDLGTTNSALAYVDMKDESRSILQLAVPQLVSEAALGERAGLPSFLYLAGEHDLPRGSLALPWDADRDYAVGEFARIQGARVPGRLISSAKSWLCHGGVDREADILPWAAADDVEKISPVEASARYLRHFREAWNRKFPGDPLEKQDIVLTVPASFDEVARELTVQAVEKAGLARAVLLEEPQAAFYAWIQAHQDDWERRLDGIDLIVVIDIGGGTTDFSLVAVNRDGPHLDLDRRAVGDHLLLGGDNVDVALARMLEPRLGTKLDSQRWHALTSLCRTAKEAMLGSEAPDRLPIRLVGRGRSVIGGAVATSLARVEVERVAVDGFFPLTAPDSFPRRTERLGLQEWGLPFASDPEVSRHLAAFLHHHCDPASHEVPAGQGDGGAEHLPDAVLFNGGALKPPLIRERLRALLTSWRGGSPPVVLESVDLETAVSRGAAYYGLVRRGLGVRIGGGSARSYYIGLAGSEDSGADTVTALCVVHRGMHEGEEIEIGSPEFAVVANRPVSFPLFASSTRLGDPGGGVVTAARDTLTELPPIRTVLRFGKKLTTRNIPVHVLSKLTEVGTLEVWCRSLVTDHRWRLQFALRDQLPPDHERDGEARREVELEVAQERIEAAARALGEIFPPDRPSGQGDPVHVTRTLEERLGAGKDAWSLATIRALWDQLWEGREARRTSHAHEARWLNLSGFFLRPGFGHETDPWRIEQLWRLISEDLTFPRAVQCRVEWWNMWKRIAPGLSRPQQMELYNRTAPFLVPRLKSKSKLQKKSAVGPQELREYWQLLASCERLSAGTKAELGSILLPAVSRGKATDAEIWALGRLGARQPFAGPLNCVVDRAIVEKWLEELLQVEWRKGSAIGFAAVQLARYVGDRDRDLNEVLRARLAERLRPLPAGERAARLITELVPLEGQERARILDESLPVGLEIRD